MIKFEKGIAKIDLETLKQTASYKDNRGKYPKSRPIEHWELLELIHEKIKSHSYGITQGDIIIPEKQSVMINGGDSLGNCLVQRLVTRIRIGNDFRGGMSIFVGFNEKGIMLGIGTTSYGKDYIFGPRLYKSYGITKIKYSELLKGLDAWLENLPAIEFIHKGVIGKMKKISLAGKEEHVLGRLIWMAVMANTKPEYVAPMSVTHVIRLVEQDKELPIPTAWDLAVSGAEVLNIEHNDTLNSLEFINRFNTFILTEYCRNDD